MWKHDKHEGGGSLASRLQAKEFRPRPDLSVVQSALRLATPDAKGLSIKGAGQPAQPIVEVKGLVSGTTAEDVKVRVRQNSYLLAILMMLYKAIFQTCGPISKARLSNTSTEQSPHVLLYYESREHALNAVTKFNGLPADGQKLIVYLASQIKTMEEKVYSSGKNEDILAMEQPSGYGLLYKFE